LPLLSPVKDKNFYVLALIERTPAAAAALGSDPALRGITRSKLDALAAAVRDCQPAPACSLAGLRWTPQEIETAAGSLGRVQRLIDGPLRDSGMYIRHHAASGDEMIVLAWREAAAGINRIFDVYGEGQAPRYPAIDSTSFDVTSVRYRQLIQTLAGVLDERRSELRLFFAPSLEFALGLLDINKRDEAGRLEPLEKGENRLAFEHIKSVAWERFPYPVIVVPGSGPDRLAWNLSPPSKLRLALAARRFKDGKAPFILVSGGCVHPNQTPYAEAAEMKKSLIADFGVPEEAILIDPHARHTTTNLRNAARLMFRYGVPFERKALITTDTFRSAAIESEAFIRRCAMELGYQPHRELGRVSPFDLEFRPRVESLHADPSDPLDP
jgi:hypothetical protein